MDYLEDLNQHGSLCDYKRAKGREYRERLDDYDVIEADREWQEYINSKELDKELNQQKELF